MTWQLEWPRWLSLRIGLVWLCLRWEMCLGRSLRGSSLSSTSPAGQILGCPSPLLECSSSSKKWRIATLSMLGPLWSIVGEWVNSFTLLASLFYQSYLTACRICVCQCGRWEDRYLYCDRCHVGHDDRWEEGGRVRFCHQDQSAALPDGPDWRKSKVIILHWSSFFSSSFSCSSPTSLCATDAVRVHLPGIVRALLIRRHWAGSDFVGVPSGQTLRPLTWSWLQWSWGWIQGLFVCLSILAKRQWVFLTPSVLMTWYLMVSISQFLETDVHQDSEW